MLNNSQRDPRWKNILLGTSDLTLGQAGCTITALGNILDTTPDLVNDRLKQVGGYAEGNLVIWAKLEEAFPGIKIKRVWTYDNEDVKKNVPNVLVEVDGKPIGGYRHWVVYIGNKKALDPWTGTEVSTSQYPSPLSYCVIGGKWNKPSPTIDIQTELDKAREARDSHWNDITAIADKLKTATNRDIILTEIEKLLNYEDAVMQKEKQIQDATTKIEQLQFQVKQLLKDHEKLSAENQKLVIITDEQQTKIENLSHEAQDRQRTIDEQGDTITTMQENLEALKRSTSAPVFEGFRKFIYDLISWRR